MELKIDSTSIIVTSETEIKSLGEGIRDIIPINTMEIGYK